MRFDVAALEFRGKMQLLCSSFRRSSKFRGSAAPADAAPLHADAAHCSSFAAHCSSYAFPWKTWQRRGGEVVERGETIPSKPIGMVGVVHNLFINFYRYNGEKRLQNYEQIEIFNLL